VAIDGELFRAVLGSFPTGVTVVTAVDHAGIPRGLTSNAICSASAEPPLLLVCIDKRSNTLPALLESGHFVVNFLAAGRGELATHFASRLADKFTHVRWEPSPLAAGAPVLVEDTVAHAECVVTQTLDAGDHIVLLGRIEAASSNGGIPLMYLRRTYAAWPDTEPAPRDEEIHG
jgi:flavin reductase (DIM6/NTAB) family NADH-FMN oxidoreductase RutF